jgi:[ribosomal protein S18]-alanine N-acetyltransferase
VKVRTALPADCSAIADLEARSSTVRWSESAVSALLAQPGAEGWVVGEPVVGHLLTRVVADEAEILTLAVDPDHRRSGLATLLLGAAAAGWRERGVQAAWLEVRVDNRAALALYRGQGWVDAGRRPAYYSDGVDAWVLRWSPC